MAEHISLNRYCIFAFLRNTTISGIGVSITFSFFVIAALFFLPASTAHSAENVQKEQIESNIQKYWINIQRLQEGIKLQQGEIEDNLSKERDLLSDMEQLDAHIDEQQEKIDALQAKISTQQQLINEKEAELAKARSAKQVVQLHLEKRLGAYYKMGSIGIFNVAFSAHTLPELMSFHDSFQTLIRHDQDLIDVYRKSIDDLEKAKEAQTLQQSVLKDFVGQDEKEKQQLDATKQEKESLLTLIRTKSKLHEQAIKEMEEASQSLSKHLTVLQKKEQVLDQGFLLHRGKLPPPVKGTVITLFMQEKTNRLGITAQSRGIDIKAPDGTKVHAIYDGTILYSGYLKGYGNTVIVDHGYQYYSIISRVEKLLKNKGDQVKQGDIIAVMGDTATLIDEGLYLEIRHGNESLDPLEWLAKSKLEFATNKE